MDAPLQIALVGNYDPAVPAHQAIPLALDLAATNLTCAVDPTWLPTEEVTTDAQLANFDAVWCVPASPYRSMEGALRAIQFARETGRPYLGTCGGFQHALIEYARHVVGWTDADHLETAPDALRPVIALLSCGLVEVTGSLRLRPGSRLAAAYGSTVATEEYHCRYGLNPRFCSMLESGPLEISAEDDAGDVRGVELTGHPFFVATLFQPERAALSGRLPPLIRAFVDAARAVRTP